jgi:hypothetical protein
VRRTRLWMPVGLALAVVSGTAAAQTTFTTAPHRKPPQLVDHHGEARKPLRIISFVPADYPNVATLQYFGNAIAVSKWLRAVAGAYGFAAGTDAVGYRVTDMPKLTSHSKASTYQTWIWGKMLQLGIKPAPDKQTIFILYIPCKAPQALDGFHCTSHHPKIVPTITEPGFTNLDSMAVVTGDPSSATDSKTATASHELAEAVTDTGNGYSIIATSKARPWAGNETAFVEDEDLGVVEAADMSSGARWQEQFFSTSPPLEATYTYQRIYANRPARRGGDPAVPASPHPYYNVTAGQNWYEVTAGDSAKSVNITGWSTKKIPPWTVTAAITTWTDSRNGSTNPCSISGKTSWSIANNDTFALKVKARNGTKGEWCDIRLRSSAAPANNADTSHPWFVGFHIT